MKIAKIDIETLAVTIFPTIISAAEDAGMNRNTFTRKIKGNGVVYVGTHTAFPIRYVIPNIITK